MQNFLFANLFFISLARHLVPAVGQSDFSDPATFQADIVSEHNKDRAINHAAPLTWDDSLASFANGVVSGCVFQHSGGPYGENLGAGYSSATDTVAAWYAENTKYNYTAGQFSEETGHFSQVVWLATTTIGCAVKECDGSNGTPGWYVACEYSPAGNVIGQFTQNVLPP